MPMPSISPDTVIAEISSATARRYFGVGVLMVLGAVLLYLTFSAPPSSVGWQILIGLMGFGALWLGNATWRASAMTLELTGTELRVQGGQVICRIEDVVSINRGTFALKPSNGFLIRTKTAGPRHWAPGVWWRIGKSIGIGGVTPASQSKFMSEVMQAQLVELQKD
jgi:hypothetical protein